MKCGSQDFMLQKGLPPDLLIVLDRSGSMDSAPPAGGATKWVQVATALKQTVMQLQGQIKWGIEYFPTDNDCGVSANVDVPIGALNATQIQMSIDAHTPNGNTPTRAGIDTGMKYLQTVQDPNPKYILLATDGEPNCAVGAPPSGTCTSCPPGTTPMGQTCCFGAVCIIPCPGSIPGGPDAAGAVAAVDAAAKAGIGTFVIGIATGGAEQVMNDMADKGGHARPGPQKYYPVANQQDLVNAVGAIAGQIISCTFPLQSPPSSPDLVDVFVNGTKVSQDKSHMNGWDYGPGNNSIQFYGAACTSLQSGSAQQVQAVYNCPPIS
jgi:hypothetical protein